MAKEEKVMAKDALEMLKRYVCELVYENAEKYRGKDNEYIYFDILENELNDTIDEGVYDGMDKIAELYPDHDYCDENEDKWKSEGTWLCGRD